MIYKVSTTGAQAEVVFHDLGARTLTHPTVELDLGLEYTEEELKASNDLQNALSNNWLTLDEEQDTSATKEYVDTTVSGAILEKGSLATVQVEREGTVTVNTTWTDFDFTSTIYQNDINTLEHNSSDTTEILIKAEGTYSVTYGLVVEAATATTTTYSRALMNGVLIPGSDSEIRTYQGERHELGGNATFDADSGDIVTVQHQRSTDGSVDIVRSSANVIKLDGVVGQPGPTGPAGQDGKDGVLTVSGTADYFNGYDSAGTTQLNTSYTDIPLTAGYTTSAFSHSGAEVTINQDNTYVIVGRFTVAQPVTSSRSEAQMRLVLDQGGGYNEIPGTIGVCYSRNDSQGKSTAEAHVVLDLVAGDKIKLQAQTNSGGTLFGDQNGSGIMLFTTAGQTGPQGIQGIPGLNGADGADGVDGIDAGGTLAVVQARRSTSYTLTTTYADVALDTTDEENDSELLEHSSANTARIDVKDYGAFLVSYSADIDAPGTAAQVTYAEAQVLKDGATVVPGSYGRTTTFNETSLDGNPLFYNNLSKSFIVTFTEAGSLTLQMRYSEDQATVAAGCTFKVVKLVGARGADGVDGAPGPAGSGSSIVVRDESGSFLINTPNTDLRFSGGGMNCTAEGDTTARIHVEGTIQAQNEGSDITSAPWTPANFKKINFVGDGIYAALTASDIVTVTVNQPVFGQGYDYASAETQTTTTSTSPVNKLTMTTSSLDAGDYKINWYYEWRRDSNSSDFRAQVVIDSTTTIMEQSEESQDNNSWHTEGGFYNHTFTAGSHTIELDYWGESTSTSYIRRARIELWRVG